MNTDEKILQETLRALFEEWDRSDKQEQAFANAQNLAKVEDFALQLVEKVAPNINIVLIILICSFLMFFLRFKFYIICICTFALKSTKSLKNFIKIFI